MFLIVYSLGTTVINIHVVIFENCWKFIFLLPWSIVKQKDISILCIHETEKWDFCTTVYAS